VRAQARPASTEPFVLFNTVLFTGNANPALAQEIATNLGIELGKAKVVRPGQDVVFVSSGLMTMRGLLAAEELRTRGVDVCVVHVPTLKPFDAQTVVSQIDTDRIAFTLENHTIVGGLYESVASALIQRGIGRKVRAIGLPDAFLDAGALNTLHDRYGLSKQAVVDRVLAELVAP